MTHSTKSKEEIDKIIEDAMRFAENCEKGLAELKVMNKHKQFLLKEYRTNPGWFGEDGSIEDIIKTCFDYGWACRGDNDIKVE